MQNKKDSKKKKNSENKIYAGYALRLVEPEDIVIVLPEVYEK